MYYVGIDVSKYKHAVLFLISQAILSLMTLYLPIHSKVLNRSKHFFLQLLPLMI